MDLNALTGLISSVGFPIFCCCIMGWYIAKKQDKIEDSVNQMTLSMQELTDAINKTSKSS